MKRGVVVWSVSLVVLALAVSARADDDVLTQKPEIAASVVVEPGKPVDPAAPRDAFHLLPGFQVERLFTVPKETWGSWCAMTIDPKGRVIAAAEAKRGLFRITPPPVGSNEPVKVERLKIDIPAAQGLLFAFDSLYVTHNGGHSALYRVRDTNGDDQFDEVKLLKELHGGGDHGPHAPRVSPDGKRLLLLAGNNTATPLGMTSDPAERMGGVRSGQRHAKLEPGSASRPTPTWDEDLLLPREWDAGGHAVGVLAPGGWIAATDPDGREWELLTIGFRNAYDMALNADGETFTYDADMEWDMGLPWYKPTRVLHCTSGAEFGWRSGSGKWPVYWLDSLPSAVDMGPGSPVGVEFGYGAKFPAKYQTALFCLDWSYGTISAVHLTPDGASYTGTREDFLSRSPLPLTDCGIGPDGALYFTTGGRDTQSEVYRVSYVGNESTAPVDPRDNRFADQRELRHKIEAYQASVDDPAAAAKFLIPYLAHADRFIRYAARVSLEHVPTQYWQQQVLADKNPDSVIGGVVGLAHVVDSPEQPKLLAALDRLDLGKLSVRQQLDALRAWSLALIRLGAPPAEAAAHLAEKLNPLFPVTSSRVASLAERNALDRQLCEMLVFLKAPGIVAKTMALLAEPTEQAPADDAGQLTELASRNAQFGGGVLSTLKNPPETQKLAYVFALRNLREGWTPDERVAYFRWFAGAREKGGGHSYQLYLTNIEQEAYDNATDTDRLVVEAAGVRQVAKGPELPAAVGPGRSYTIDELVALSAAHPKGRDFANGKRTFAAARCVVCHRFEREGGSTGPDLTQAAGRFNVRDLAESLVEPNKVISDQYRATVIETNDGRSFVGRVISERPDSLTLLTDPEVATRWVNISKANIEHREPSPTSLMPANLLGALNETEVLDLLAYLLSRGNPQDAMFSK